MSEHYWQKSESRKLAEAYVALELAKDVARGYVEERKGHEVLQPVMTILDITAKLLEDVLESVLFEEEDGFSQEEGMSSSSAELVM